MLYASQQCREEGCASVFCMQMLPSGSQKWQCLACASMQLPGESIVKKTTTWKSGIFLNHYSKRTTEYVTTHKAVKNGWKFKITSIENQLFVTLSLT